MSDDNFNKDNDLELTPESASSEPDGRAPLPDQEAADSAVPGEAMEVLESVPGGSESDWKARLRHDFETWLTTVDEIPEGSDECAPPEAPDLYSFYAQWAAANTEARKANRRTADAFSQWGETLAHFEGDLRLLREQLQRFSAGASPPEALTRAQCLSLAELLDRMQRVARAFGTPPPAPWWGGGRHWRRAWENQRQAFEILVSHVETWLKREGVTRIATLGLPFDPTVMTAVATEFDSSRPHHTILEELAAGYRRQGDLLRLAQVKVSLNKAETAT
jgi:hypothetical protein